ncbi:hypothetical protein [Streptomyces sp. SID8352]|nr:hypothetical protein [Streptomyces sp. SID8352]MYU20794.1 hypothetical protein [Streptomyces sp. SID8352]
MTTPADVGLAAKALAEETRQRIESAKQAALDAEAARAAAAEIIAAQQSQ